MGSRIEILRAYLRARREVVPAQVESGSVPPVETAAEFELRFRERNVLGLSLEEARVEAARELAGLPGRYPGYSFGLSTGTATGRAGVFLTTEAERNVWLGTILARFVPLRMLLSGCDVALVLKHNNQLYTGANRQRGLRFHYFPAGEPVASWVEELRRLAPQILIGPPSILEQIAATAEGTKPLRPALLIAGAEPMYPQDAARLEQAFGVKPRVIYQAKEGFLAAACRLGSIHWNDDVVRLEKLALPRGRFVPVITDFTRSSQLYRRYRLDDILVSAPISCGCRSRLQTIAAVEGRAQDVLLTEDGPLFPHEVNELALPVEQDYRIVQTAPQRIEVSSPGLADVLAAKFRGVEVAVKSFEPLPPGAKRRRIIRAFDPHDDWITRFSVSTNRFSGS